MSAARRCSQCLIGNTIGCLEPECPGADGFLEVASLLPDRNLRETMGRRIADLEGLVSRAGAYFENREKGEMEVVQDVMAEAVRIRGYGLPAEKRRVGERRRGAPTRE